MRHPADVHRRAWNSVQLGTLIWGNAAAPMIVEEIPFGFVERLAASCLVGHMLITYVARGSLGCVRMYQTVSSFSHGRLSSSVFIMKS